MSVTKKKITHELIKKTNMTDAKASEIVNIFFSTIKKVLANGEDVKLSGFGNFILNDKKSRPGRNPKTAKSYIISARRVVTFKAGNKLKNIVNSSN